MEPGKFERPRANNARQTTGKPLRTAWISCYCRRGSYRFILEQGSLRGLRFQRRILPLMGLSADWHPEFNVRPPSAALNLIEFKEAQAKSQTDERLLFVLTSTLFFAKHLFLRVSA